MPLRLAALVKQIPVFEAMELGPDGRLRRDGLPLEMSAYCRRAVAQAVALAAAHGGSVTVLTMGPPSARDVLREALAHADGRGEPAGREAVPARAVLLSDPVLAGADTLATARALAAAVGRLEDADGPFDLILAGRNSVDADTGQVPPQLAELLDRPFLTGVKRLELRGELGEGPVLFAGCELDDLWEEAEVALPAVVSAAERLIDPCKIKDSALWVADDDERIAVFGAADLGPGPWGAAASPTSVGEVRSVTTERAGRVLAGTMAEQVRSVVELMAARGLLEGSAPGATAGFGVEVPEPVVVPARRPAAAGQPVVGVVAEPDRARLTRELTAAAATLASRIGGEVHVVGNDLESSDAEALAPWGADHLVALRPEAPPAGALPAAEDVVVGMSAWAQQVGPWAVLAGGTPWGREVASRLAASLGAGLTGDAVALEEVDGRLVAWKPAFGGALVAAIRVSSPVQLATVRSGVLALPEPRQAPPALWRELPFRPRGRVTLRSRRREDDADRLAEATRVVGVGQGVPPERYGELDGLLEVLGAELAATRKVTDRGWLPHARQLGITGKSIAPDLYVALGTSGRFNHSVGVRAAGTVVAVNTDPAAPVFGFADVGVVGDWAAFAQELARQLRATTRS